MSDSLCGVRIGVNGRMAMRCAPRKREQCALENLHRMAYDADVSSGRRSRQTFLLRFAHECGAMLCRK